MYCVCMYVCMYVCRCLIQTSERRPSRGARRWWCFSSSGGGNVKRSILKIVMSVYYERSKQKHVCSVMVGVGTSIDGSFGWVLTVVKRMFTLFSKVGV